MAKQEDDTAALFVRLPREAADALDREAFETKTPKRELVTRLVTRHLGHGGWSHGGGPARAPRAVQAEMALGHHQFRPAPGADVLTLAEAADLLQVDEAAVRQLAESGELPGREIDGAWRFARSAILDWLRG